jgi:hypothetical protein
MHNLNDIEHDRQRRAALMHDAAMYRLATSGQLARSHTRHLRPFAAWAGGQMVVLGQRLLELAREYDYPANPMYNGTNSTVKQP